jgi:maleamate amidohydrolase
VADADPGLPSTPCSPGFDTLVVADACGDRARGPHDAALDDLQAEDADVVALDDAAAYLDDPFRKAER